VLAGLINDQDTRTSSGIPGLGDIPVVGRLFKSQKDDRQKTEIMLLVTPHLVRNMTLPNVTASEFLSGSETNAEESGRSAARRRAKVADVRTDAPAGRVRRGNHRDRRRGYSLDWNGPRETRAATSSTWHWS